MFAAGLGERESEIHVLRARGSVPHHTTSFWVSVAVHSTCSRLWCFQAADFAAIKLWLKADVNVLLGIVYMALMERAAFVFCFCFEDLIVNTMLVHVCRTGGLRAFEINPHNNNSNRFLSQETKNSQVLSCIQPFKALFDYSQYTYMD
jgi:hypothetical protein